MRTGTKCVLMLSFFVGHITSFHAWTHGIRKRIRLAQFEAHPLKVIRQLEPSPTATSFTPVTSEVDVVATRERQILSFREPSTGVLVKLVGSMHYNPHSIKTAKSVVRELGDIDKLGSLIVESCPQRWNKTITNQPRGSLLRAVLSNEMQAAAELAELKYSRPILLGDQDISLTNKRMKDSFLQSITDIVTPWHGGWKGIVDDLTKTFAEAFPSGEGYLGLGDFFDISLLTAAPLSLIRYPLAILIKSPKFAIPAFTIAAYAMATAVGEDGGFVGQTIPERVVELGTSVAIFGLEVALLGRTFLVALLAERNIVLADSILSACKMHKAAAAGREGEVAVVAILGMAHCNGVKKILTEGKL